MAKVTFEDKADLTEKAVPDINKIVAADINEIKAALNENADLLDSVASGHIGSILSTDPAPTQDGIYSCIDSGTYTNFGGEVVDLTNQIVSISVESGQTVFNQLITTVPSVQLTGDIAEGETDGVTGGKIFDALLNKASKDSVKLKADVIVGTNLFNKTDAIDGYYTLYTSGALVISTEYFTSDYIPILPNTDYYLNLTGNSWFTFFDSDKSYISGNTVREISPSNAAYIRINGTPLSKKDTAQLELGTTSTPYQPYEVKMNVPVIDDLIEFDNLTDSAKSTIKASEVDVAKQYASIHFESFNLFDKSAITTGYFINENGTSTANALYGTSDFCVVDESSTYKITGQGATITVVWYDINKSYISGEYLAGVSIITSPANAAFLKFNIFLAQEDTTILESGSTFTGYRPYFLKLKPAIRDEGVFSSLNINIIGDSVTEIGTHINFLDENIKPLLIRNYGISGTELVINNGFGDSVINRVDGMDNTAEIIIIEGGINDFKNGTTPLGTISDSASVQSIYGGLRGICEKLVVKYPAAYIFFRTPTQCGVPFCDIDGYNSLGDHLTDYVKAYNDVCSLFSYYIIDTMKLSGINPKNISSYSGDSLHPNTLASKRISNLIASDLRKLIT